MLHATQPEISYTQPTGLCGSGLQFHKLLRIQGRPRHMSFRHVVTQKA